MHVLCLLHEIANILVNISINIANRRHLRTIYQKIFWHLLPRHIETETMLVVIFLLTFSNIFVSISIKLSMKFVSKGPINKFPALVQIKARRQPGYKPLFEQMMVR